MHFRPVRTKYAVAVLGSWPRGQSSKGRAPRAELQGQSSKGSVMSSVFAHSSATFLLEILEPVKTNSRAECLADGAWPVSPNMKHRATIKGLNESTDTNWQTQTDCHNKHNQTGIEMEEILDVPTIVLRCATHRTQNQSWVFRQQAPERK